METNYTLSHRIIYSSNGSGWIIKSACFNKSARIYNAKIIEALWRINNNCPQKNDYKLYELAWNALEDANMLNYNQAYDALESYPYDY